MIVKESPFQIIEVKEYNDGNIALVEKNKVNGEWKNKVMLLSRSEALRVNSAISNIILGYK